MDVQTCAIIANMFFHIYGFISKLKIELKVIKKYELYTIWINEIKALVFLIIP